MKRILLVLALFGACGFAAPILILTPDLPVDPSALNQGFQATLGYEFTLSRAYTIRALGVYDSGDDGLANNHTVDVWDSNQNIVATGFIPSGSVAILSAHFRYMPISPVVLLPGTYVIGSDSGDTDPWTYTYNPAHFALTSGATFIEDRYAVSGPLVYPTASVCPNGECGAQFGPNMSDTPEPGTLGLLGCAITALGLLRFKMRSR